MQTDFLMSREDDDCHYILQFYYNRTHKHTHAYIIRELDTCDDHDEIMYVCVSVNVYLCRFVTKYSNCIDGSSVFIAVRVS